MKKILLLIGVLGVLGLTACAKKDEKTETTEASVEIKAGDEGDNTEEKSTENPGGAASKAATEVQGNDGKDYELTKTENSDISGLSQGIEIGAKVEVIFDKDMNIISMVDPGK